MAPRYAVHLGGLRHAARVSRLPSRPRGSWQAQPKSLLGEPSGASRTAAATRRGRRAIDEFLDYLREGTLPGGVKLHKFLGLATILGYDREDG